MKSKFILSALYAFILSMWPPDNGKGQDRKIDTVTIEPFDSGDFYKLVEEKARFRVVSGTTKAIQREALKNLAELEKRKLLRYDTVLVYIPVYDTIKTDTPKHKNFFQRIFNK